MARPWLPENGLSMGTFDVKYKGDSGQGIDRAVNYDDLSCRPTVFYGVSLQVPVTMFTYVLSK